jgi:hypothetical protein
MFHLNIAKHSACFHILFGKKKTKRAKEEKKIKLLFFLSCVSLVGLIYEKEEKC